MLYKRMSTFCLISLFLSVSLPTQASYIDRKAEGWHYYEDRKQPLTKDISPKKEEAKKSPNDPVERLARFKKELETLKAVAVMDPTFDNVQAYMVFQKKMMKKSSKFAQKWMEVVFTTPELDYTVKHPTSQTARHVYLDQEKLKMEQEIKRLSQTHGLFFFFMKGCSYCKNFAPIVKAFSKKYGWDVIAISLDGSSLPEFPDAVQDNGSAAQLGVTVIPTLLAVNPQKEQVVPLSHGMSSQDQILERIRVLILERKSQ